MAISSNELAVRYTGTGNTTTKYPVTFPFLSPEHIFVAVSPDGVAPPVVLSNTAFTFHAPINDQPAGITTHLPYPETARVTVFRDLLLTQPTVFQPHGPFPAKANEQALDRLLMQIQQVNRAVQELRGVENGPEIIDVPKGGGLHEVEVWVNASERGGIRPRWAGQLGFERSTATLWVAQSIGMGAWAPYVPPKTRLTESFVLLPFSEPVGETFERNFHVLPFNLRLESVTVSSQALDTSTILDWEVSSDIDETFAVTGLLGGSVNTATFPVPADLQQRFTHDVLRLETSCDGDVYGVLGGRQGLEVSLHYTVV